MPAPPYALAPLRFSFPALAAVAGRAPLGGEREVALACFMAARLAAAALPATDRSAPVAAAGRAARATGARAWFAAVSLPAALRLAVARLVEASAEDDRAALAVALDGVTAVAAPHLDAGARSELAELATELLGR